MAVLAIQSPADAFACAYEACRVAIQYRVPVMLLSDGSIANGAEPWRIPNVSELPAIDAALLDSADSLNGEALLPYARDPETLARPWIKLGVPGLEHRIGGIEKWDKTGHISYDPANHHAMVKLRQAKVDAIAKTLPPCAVTGPETGDLLVVTWGSPWGSALTAARELQAEGKSVAHLQVRWLSPLPADLGAILGRYKRVLVPEINNGQLVKLLRATYAIDCQGYQRIAGQPLTVGELKAAMVELLPS